MAAVSSLTNVAIKPSMAWLLVFVPAFSYFVATRLSSSGFRWGRSHSLGEPVSMQLQLQSPESCEELSKLFYLPSGTCQTHKHLTELPLQYGLHLLYGGRGMQDIVASTWKHDEELGRGYLLFSQSHRNGRVWRWEMGGGPISIGRSLHLEASGCRSHLWQQCHASNNDNDNSTTTTTANPVGSGGMAIDFHQSSASDKASEGALVLAEWGEGRIIRMEESNGARTPLIIQVPDVCGSGGKSASDSGRRLYQPKSLLFTPYGDLLVADLDPACDRSVIYRLSQAVHVEPLESLGISRQAHGWNETQHKFPVEILYHKQAKRIGGMAMDPSWLNMYATIQDMEGKIFLIQLPIMTMEEDAEDDSNDSDDEEKESKKDAKDGSDDEEAATEAATTKMKTPRGLLDDNAKIIMDLSKALGLNAPGPIVVSEKGFVFLATSQGVAVVSTTTNPPTVLGTLPTPEPPTSLTLGEDKFLYALTKDAMFRILVREGPVMIPTNLVVGKPQSKK